MATTLFEVDTRLTADSVEWCPYPGSEQLLACGTYQLDSGNVRHGALSVYHLSSTPTPQLTQVAQPELDDGILDMKWCCLEEDCPCLALASSHGTAVLAHVRAAGTQAPEVKVRETVQICAATKDGDKQGLCLSLDWSRSQSQPRVLAVSDSLGRVSIAQLTDSGARLLCGWRAHNFEAWITAFGHTPHLVFSGGDDCRLCGWDVRADTAAPSFTSKWYQMGVCSLQIHPTKEHILASGSYDEHLLLWDVRSMARPLKEAGLGGGIWRVKWNPAHSSDELLAAACMHNGCCVVNTNIQSGNPIETVAVYKEHKSLAYGIDWFQQPVSKPAPVVADDGDGRESLRGTGAAALQRKSGDSEAVLASCSFYDKSLHLWKMKLPAESAEDRS